MRELPRVDLVNEGFERAHCGAVEIRIPFGMAGERPVVWTTQADVAIFLKDSENVAAEEELSVATRAASQRDDQ